MAFLARYGHQQIPLYLGRSLSALETRLLSAAVLDLVREERASPDPLGGMHDD
jgi:hypothetical protein